MKMRRGTTVLLLALLIVSLPTVAMATPASDGDAVGWQGAAEWLAGLGEWWQGVLELTAASETGSDPDGSTTTTQEPEPPEGELGPWISPDGAADEGPEAGLDA